MSTREQSRDSGSEDVLLDTSDSQDELSTGPQLSRPGLYERLFNNIPVGMYRNEPGPNGTFIEANEVLLEMFGFDNLEQLRDAEVRDLYADPADREEFSDVLLEQGYVKEKEIKLLGADGEPFWGAVTAMVTKEDGETYFDGVIQDITERKTVENQMKQERDMLASAVEFQERIVGCQFDFDRTLEVIGSSIQELIDPDSILIYFEDEGQLRTKYVEGIDESRVSDTKSIGGTVAGRCYRYRDVHFCRNTRDCQEEPGVSNLFEGGSLLYVPLAHEDEKFGVLEIFFREESHPGRVQENILRLVAGAVSSAIHMALQREEMEEYIDQIEEMARTDQLTGLTNRRDFMRRLDTEAKRAQRYDNRFSLGLLDLDHFKAVNDRYGHVTGDRVLEKVAELLESEVREPDTVARYGGEEFAILLPETRLGEARNICERILEVMRNHTYEHDGSEFSVTCSIGLVEYHSERDVDDLIRRVDRALYQAKEQGRDRYVLLEE